MVPADSGDSLGGSGLSSGPSLPAATPLTISVMPSRWPLMLALASVYVIWGSTYYAMRIAVEGLPPMFMGSVRFVIAGGILMTWLVLRGAARPTARQWLSALVVGGLLFAGGNGLVAVAERSIGSGIAAVAVATMPLWLAVFATVTGERPSRREWIGLGVGLAGVVVLSSGGELRADIGATALLLLSPVSWAAGSLLARRLPLPAGMMAAASEMLAGGALLVVLSVVAGERWPSSPPAESLAAVAYLIVFGSLIAFSAFSWLLRNTRPSVATSYAYVNPGLAVFLGAALGAETVGWSTLVATPLIAGAVALLVLGKRAPDRATRAPSSAR